MKKIYLTALIFAMAQRAIFAQNLEEISTKLIIEHPEIRTMESELKSRRSDSEHKSTYPDPKIGIAYRNYPYSKDGRLIDSRPNTPTMTGIEYSISQEIPFPGKLSTEGKIGKLNSIEFEHFTKAQKNKFLKEFYLLLLKLHITENKILWNKSVAQTLASLEKISKSNYSAGKNPYVEVIKNKVNLTMTKDKEIELALTKESLIGSLRYYTDPIQLNSEKLLKVNILDFLTGKQKEVEPKNFEIAKKLLPKNPSLLFTEASVQKSKAEEKLAKLAHLPETEIFFAYMKRRDQKFSVDQGPIEYRIMDQTEFRGDLMSFGLTMRVPVWSLLTSSALSDREEEKVKASLSETNKKEVELESILRNALALFAGAEKQLKLHDEILIPQLKQAQIAQSAVYQNRKSELSDTLQLKMELYNSHFSREDLLEKKYSSLLTILELSDRLMPESKFHKLEMKGEKE